MVVIPVYTFFSSYWLRLNFCPVVALEPSMFPNSLDHCLRYAVQLRLGELGEGALYGQGFFPGLGVLPGSFFNAVHRGTLPLASPGTLK